MLKKIEIKIMSLALLSQILSMLIVATVFADTNDNPSDKDSWFDITVLKAHVLRDITLRNFDQVENCNKYYDNWENYYGYRYHVEKFDCTNYISSKMNATIVKKIPDWVFINGNLQRGSYGNLDLDAPIVEILTVTPIEKLRRSSYIGFSESFMGGRVNLFKSIGNDGQTREVGKVTLKDGRIGVVHRWIMSFESTGCCTLSGNNLRTLPFKPVLVRYDNGNQLNYWDKLIGDGMFKDYVISNNTANNSYPFGYQDKTPNFYDRSAEVLLQ